MKNFREYFIAFIIIGLAFLLAGLVTGCGRSKSKPIFADSGWHPVDTLLNDSTIVINRRYTGPIDTIKFIAFSARRYWHVTYLSGSARNSETWSFGSVDLWSDGMFNKDQICKDIKSQKGSAQLKGIIIQSIYEFKDSIDYATFTK